VYEPDHTVVATSQEKQRVRDDQSHTLAGPMAPVKEPSAMFPFIAGVALGAVGTRLRV